jgi:hypothetical protein
MHANDETHQIIATLIDDIEARRFQRAALGPMVERGRAEPRAILALLEAVLHRLPSGGTHVDILLAFLPEPLWTELVAVAVAIARQSPHNDAAIRVLRQAGLQLPETLHPYLEAIFRIESLAEVELAQAFRGAPLEAVTFLFDPLTEGAERERRRACRALLETRRIEVLTFAEQSSDAFAALLPEVGFEVAQGGFRQLYTPRALHVAFPTAYLDRLAPDVTERSLGISHPTWQPASPDRLRGNRSAAEAPDQGHRVGGAVSARCAICGQRLARLLRLDPVPTAVGVRGLLRLELVACFSCLGWERELLHYRHEDGQAASWLPETRDGRDGREGGALLGAGDHVARGDAPDDGPEMESAGGALEACPVELIDLGPRFAHQDWCTRENLHRVGGHPVWITGPAYPACPGCGVTSMHLAQIDSELLTGEGLAWTWGDGGICYVAWCDRCRVSTVYWQCA